MNPPFAIDEPEIDFVDHALSQMKKGGLLFAVLPNRPVTGDDTAHTNWRKETLKRHTLRGVVKLHEDLFYLYASKGTYAIILEIGRAHKEEDDVIFGIMRDDESAGYKSKLLGKNRKKDNVEMLTDNFSRFIQDGRAKIDPVQEELSVSTLNIHGLWDFSPEAYIDELAPEILSGISVKGLFSEMTRRISEKKSGYRVTPEKTKIFVLEDLFEMSRGRCPSMNTLELGNTPVVTSSESFNGVKGYYKVPEEFISEDCITISANGSGGAAFYHPYSFSATQDAYVCVWNKNWKQTLALCLYVCDEINRNAWRYCYYRKGSKKRLVSDTKICLPMKGEKVDTDYIRRAMNKVPGYKQMKEFIERNSMQK